MKKKRLLKKDYKRMIRELKEHERWVDSQLGKVQIMHQRAISALKKERDELRQMLTDKRSVMRSNNFSCNAEIVLDPENAFNGMPQIWLSGTSVRAISDWDEHYVLRMIFSSEKERVSQEQCQILEEPFGRILAFAQNPDKNKDVTNG